MAYLMALALGIVLLLTPSPRSWAAQYVSPLGESVTDYCGTYDAMGATNPEKWLECRKEWERLKALEGQQLRERWLQQQRQEQERQRQEAERRRQIELEERRTRAMEEAARAQREQAEISGRPLVCGWIYDFNVGRVWQCERR